MRSYSAYSPASGCSHKRPRRFFLAHRALAPALCLTLSLGWTAGAFPASPAPWGGAQGPWFQAAVPEAISTRGSAMGIQRDPGRQESELPLWGPRAGPGGSCNLLDAGDLRPATGLEFPHWSWGMRVVGGVYLSPPASPRMGRGSHQLCLS